MITPPFNYLSISCFFRLLSLLSLVSLSWSVSALEPRTITLVGDPWPPYVNAKMGEDATSGIAVEISNEIFSRLENVEVRYPTIPWKRALREVELGYHDGVSMCLKTAEREKFMAYTDPLLVGRNLVWSVADKNGQPFEWDSFEEFHGLRIGIVPDYSYGKEFDELIRTNKVQTFPGPTQKHLFTMLANGRIDIVMANDAVGGRLASDISQVQIKAASRATNSETFYMAFSRKSSAMKLIPEINKILEDLVEEGFIEKVINSQ